MLYDLILQITIEHCFGTQDGIVCATDPALQVVVN